MRSGAGTAGRPFFHGLKDVFVFFPGVNEHRHACNGT